MRKPILLIGAGGHALSCIDVIEQEDCYDIIGLIGLESEVGNDVLGYPIIGCDKDLPNILKNKVNVLITIGQIKTYKLRKFFFDLTNSYGCYMPSIISSKAYVSSSSKIGEGTIIMHGAIINAGATIGSNCIINSRALIEHGVMIHDHCHIATASIINGDVTIGCGTFIGSGSIVRQSQIIGERCVIGMGQHIYYDCDSDIKIPQHGAIK